MWKCLREDAGRNHSVISSFHLPHTPPASDINLLLVGDPSTAKSQMLRYENHIVSNYYVVSTARKVM